MGGQTTIVLTGSIRKVPVLLLTGPAGAGKNTVALVLASKLARCAVIDVDLVRHMVIKPHHAPWDGVEGIAQHHLGAQNACVLARNFLNAEFSVLILDVISEELAQAYSNNLRGIPYRCIRLLPSFDEVRRRNHNRGMRITEQEVLMLYEQQARLTACDQTIDNTHLEVDRVADILPELILQNHITTADR